MENTDAIIKGYSISDDELEYSTTPTYGRVAMFNGQLYQLENIRYYKDYTLTVHKDNSRWVKVPELTREELERVTVI